MKKLLTKVLSIIVALTATLGLVMLPKTAVQASEFTFGATQGASVRFGETIEETGLRFTIEVDKEFYASLDTSVKFGALITTSKYAATNAVDFNDKTGMIADTCYVDNANKFDLEADSKNFVYYASVTYLFNDAWKEEVVSQFAGTGLSDDEIFEAAKLQALATELVCRPYYVIGEEVVYASLSDARSMLKVANAAVIDGEKVTDDFVAKYLSSVKESSSEVYIQEDGSVIGLSKDEATAVSSATLTADGNAGNLECKIEDGKLTNTSALLEGKELGNYYYLTAFNGTQAIRFRYLYVTVAIDEAEDLKVFTLTAEKEHNEVDGYYVVVKDIDASKLVLNEHKFESGAVYPGNGYSVDVGFIGTFDGLGHVIDGLNLKSNGLFGMMMSCTVRNVAFTNATVSGNYKTVFTHNISRGKTYTNSFTNVEALFENVYVSVASVATGTARVGLMANNNAYTGATYKNLVVEYLENEVHVQNNIAAGKAFYTLPCPNKDNATSSANSGKDTFSNVYSISNTPVLAHPLRPGIAINQIECVYEGANIVDVGEITDEALKAYVTARNVTVDLKNLMYGVKAYSNYAAMAKDAQANADSLATFDEKYWIVSNGVPYWKSTFASKVDVVVSDSKGNAVTSNVIIKDTETKYSLNLFDGIGNVKDVTITAPEGVLVNGNVISLASDPTSVGEHEIVVSAIVNGVAIERVVTIGYSNAYDVTGKVLYSQDDKALDLDSLNVALNQAGQPHITEDQITGYIVNGENVPTLELEVIISGTGRNRKIDTAQTVTVCVGNKAYLLNNVYAYSKIVNEAEDIKYFTMNYRNEHNEIDGYIILTKNIDATDLELDAHKFEANKNGGNQVFPGDAYSVDVGLSGVLDGQGYTIDNLTVPSCGLFGQTNAPIIRDIAFTNVNLTGYYPTLFAQTISRGKNYDGSFKTHEPLLSNIYISINSVTKGGCKRVGILASQTLASTALIKNVVVDYMNVSDDIQAQIEAKNAFYMTGSSGLSMANSTAVYKDCYVISTAPVLQHGSMPGFAQNQVEYTLTGSKVTAVGNVIDEQVTTVLTRIGKTLAIDHVIVGLRAYADYTAMANDAEANATSLATFDSEFWTVSNGVPTWKHKHYYSQTVVAPTCEEKGYTSYACDCGSTYTGDEVDALGHEYGEFTYLGNNTHGQACIHDASHVISEPCYGGEATEEQRAICEGCGHEYGDLKDHTHNFIPTVVAPTCKEAGYTVYTCKCGDNYTDDIVAIDEYAHTYGDWLYDSKLGHYAVCQHDETHVLYASNMVTDKVLYSKDDQALDFQTLKVALEEKDVQITSLSDIEGYIVNDQAVETLDLEVTITGTYANRVVDTAQTVTVIVKGAPYVLNNVYAYTKLIDEASDFDYFRFDYANTGVIPVHDGYYLVTNNIDASSYVMQDHTFATNAVYPGSNDKKGGLTGVFDGNGYTISNLTTVSNGIFGAANQPLIKNVAFTNVSLTGYYNATIANIFDGAKTKLKNVYVEVVSSTNPRIGTLTYSAIDPSASLENVVTVWDLDEAEYTRLTTTNGTFSSIAHLNYNVANYKNFYKNCVAISKAPLGMEVSGGKIKVSDDGVHKRLGVASNKVTVTTEGETTTVTTTNATLQAILNAKGYTLEPINVATGVVSYDTAEDMAKDKANNVDLLASFDSNYWVIINGVPYWKTSYYKDGFHEYTEEVVKNAALKTAATCTSNAVYYKSCKCGVVGSVETFEVEGYLPHTYDQNTVTKAALITKGEDGEPSLFYKSCVCGKLGNEATFESKEMFGKNILIFGDSYSSYIGTIPEGHLPYYKGDNILSSPDQMWWSLLAEERGGNVVRVDGSSGSTVCTAGHNPFINRLNKLYEDGFFEENQIDYVFVLGGTNDNGGHVLGEEKYSDWTQDDLNQVLPAMCYFFCRLREILPDAEIYGIANLRMKQEIIDSIYNSCEYVGGHYVGIKVELESSHPTALGMQQIKDEILKVFDAE